MSQRQQADISTQMTATWRAPLIAALLATQLAALATLYQFIIDIDCPSSGHPELCRFMRSMIGRAMALAAGALLLVLARPGTFRGFAIAAAAPTPGTGVASVMHLAGLALLILPAVFLAGGATGGDRLLLAAALWVAGGVLATAGGLRWIAPWPAWRDLLAGLGWRLVPVVLLAFLIPELTELVQPLWDVSTLTMLTFALVFLLLRLLQGQAHADPDSFVVGVDGFAVHIAPQCSGVEGFVLVGSFVAIYAVLFHKTLHPWRYWLLVLPAALLLSWLLNIVRIALLVLLGAHVSPSLAVDGFHSYAGWLFFTLLALTILAGVHAMPFLHRRDTQAPARPLRTDPAAALLLPFIAFMISGIVASAFFALPAAGYPLRVAIMLGAVLPFAAYYLQLTWRLDPFALGVGALVGLAWIWAYGGADAASDEIAVMLAGTGGAAALGWVVLRVFGTVALVPLIEEAFFRGYLLARLDRGGLAWRLAAVAVSTAAFAALHGRWLEAGLAGLAFAWVFLRRRRLGDAVLAHAAANLVVALAALASGDWGLI